MAFEDNGDYETNNPWSFGSWDQWFIAIVAIVLSVILGYLVYDVVKSTAAEMFRSLLMISPLILIIVVHWLSTPHWFNIPMPGSEPGAIHRAGGSPWGLTVILALLVFLISYRPSFHGFLF